MKGLLLKDFYSLQAEYKMYGYMLPILAVLMLFLNEETSVKTNVEYEKRINMLKKAIKVNTDSAEYYRTHRLAIEKGESDLEEIAREKYHMQRPTEDIYIFSEDD